jgi:hypothetical protein
VGGQDVDVTRLSAHAAERMDIGQGDQPRVVLAGPEGNESCVLGPRGQSRTGPEFAAVR